VSIDPAFTGLHDISGPIHADMWHYAAPYFKPEIYQLPPVEWLAEPVYSEAVHLPLQTGTYVESVAHVDPTGIAVSDVALERTVLLPSICVQVGKGPEEAIGGDELREAVGRVGSGPWAGFGLLVSTGWDTHWDDDDYLTRCPYFDDDAIDFVIEEKFSLLGGDSARFENPAAPTGHLRRLFAADVLLLAPLCHLGDLGSSFGHVIAPPLPIRGISASPVRAVWVVGLAGRP
jgi:kynurenine formamidase